MIESSKYLPSGPLVLKITFVLSVATFTFWDPIKQWTDIGIFYPGIALCFIGYLYVIQRAVMARFNELLVSKNKPIISLMRLSKYLIWCEVALMAAFSNLLDELLFDPREIAINEYLGLVIIIIYATINGRKRRKRVKGFGTED